jgi:hypothetical protein
MTDTISGLTFWLYATFLRRKKAMRSIARRKNVAEKNRTLVPVVKRRSPDCGFS